MKKLTVLMLVTLSSSLAFLSSCKKDDPADSGSGSTNTSCYVNTMDLSVFGETAKSTLTYNASNQAIEQSTVQGADVSGTLFTYNSAGQMTKSESYDDASKKITSKIEYTYGSNGVTEVKIFADDNGVPTHSETRKYEYTNGVLSRVNTYLVDMGIDNLYEYELYTMSSLGEVTKIESYEDDGNGNWVAYYRDIYSYSAQSADKFLLGLLEEDPNFPAKHYITKVEGESYNAAMQIWEPSTSIVNTYDFDSKGNPTKITLFSGLASATLTWDCR